jgi:hypothetical protein
MIELRAASLAIATANSLGINRVKSSGHFTQKANAISRMPAMLSSAHAIETDPFVDSPSVAASTTSPCRWSRWELTVETECSSVAPIRAVITTPNWTSAVFRMT